MSIIDQAAKRLEQLRTAGMDAQPGLAAPNEPPARPRGVPTVVPTPVSAPASLRGREPCNEPSKSVHLDLNLMSRAHLLVRMSSLSSNSIRVIKSTMVAKAVGAARTARGNSRGDERLPARARRSVRSTWPSAWQRRSTRRSC